MKKYLFIALLAFSPLLHAKNTCHDPHAETHTLSDGLKLTHHVCPLDKNGFRTKLVWQRGGRVVHTETFAPDEYIDMLKPEQLGNITVLDFYGERGGTLLLTHWLPENIKSYRLAYTGHDESGLCVKRLQNIVHIRRCAFGKHFGRELKLQAAAEGWKVLTPKLLPEFTDRDKLPEFPKHLYPKQTGSLKGTS